MKSWVRSLGFDVKRYDPTLRSPDEQRAWLLETRRVEIVIDVGANEGQWTRNLRRRGFSGRVVCFEPLSDAFEVLTEREKHRVALGSQDEYGVVLHVAGNSQSSSLLAMADRHVAAAPTSAYVATEIVPLRRLDSFDFAGRVFLKIDAQGAEHEILEGAAETLRACVGVELELSFVELYEGQALASDLFEFMSAQGFQVLAAWPGYADPLSREMLQLNVIFARL